MDTADPDIVFDPNGECNHCTGYFQSEKKFVLSGEEGERALSRIVDQIKKAGQGREYDCILGLSGGADSTYAAYLAKKRYGLRPLAVHMDNGWNLELAVSNIQSILETLEIDLYTYVLDWEEFKDLQLAYLKASVVDIEALTDHAIAAVLYKIAGDRGIRYIISGQNYVTERIMPLSWSHNKNDLVNIRDIHRRFGRIRRLKRFPTLGLYKRIYFRNVKHIKTLPILNYLPYIKKDAKKILAEELNWKDYGHKHYESQFTKFYQAYILPQKFNADKRKAHLSTLICSGQMTRAEALEEMRAELYSAEELRRDKEYVLEKLGLSEGEFEDIMNLPPRSHYDYQSDVKMYLFLKSVYTRFRKSG